MASDESFHGRTDTGRVRDHNEDSFLCEPTLGLFVVADGMGGHASGEVASSLAVQSLRDKIRAQRRVLQAYIADDDKRPEVLIAMLRHAVIHANASVFGEAERSADKRGMGTTLTALLMVGAHAFIAQVGDSRAYMIRDGAVRQLTEDHSMVNELKRRGKHKEAAMMKRNAITRAVGILPTVEPDVTCVQVAPGDRFVLCSDGLHQYFAGENELAPLSEGLTEEEASRRMVEYANARGGSDNVTAVVVSIPKGETSAETQREVSRVYDALSALAFFHALEPRELLHVQGLAKLKHVHDDEVVVKEGDEGNAMFVLLSGACAVFKGELKIATVQPGEHFGEMALVEAAPRSATVRACGEATLIEILRSDLFQLLRDSPTTGVKLCWNIIQVLTARLRETSAQLGEARVTSGFLSFDDDTAINLSPLFPSAENYGVALSEDDEPTTLMTVGRDTIPFAPPVKG